MRSKCGRRTCDTSHIYETYDMNWPDLSWESPSSWPMALDWLLLSQSLKVLTLQFGLTNVRPKRSVQDRGKFATGEPSVEAEKHLFLRRNQKKTASFIGKSMEWKHFLKVFFFCSVFFSQDWQWFTSNFLYSLVVFVVGETFQTKGPATKSCWGWLIFHFLLLPIILKTNVEGITWTEISQQR